MPTASDLNPVTAEPPAPATPRLILASQSPRRRQLLDEAGFAGRYAAIDPPYADPDTPPLNIFTDADARAFVADTAHRKARSLADVLLQQPLDTADVRHTVLLAADTTCVSPRGELLGKPATRDALLAMLDGFVHATHQVVTGVALLRITHAGHASATLTHDERFADAASVTWGDVSQAQRDAYADSDRWVGKAGGYNLQDRQRDGWPIAVVGDPATVTGLPLIALRPRLARLGLAAEPRP